MKLSENLRGKIRFNEPLRRHTSFKIGGNSNIWFEPKDTRDLINCLITINQAKMAYFVIGNGTNILADDDGFNGMVIRLNASSFKQISIKKDILSVGAGLHLSDLVNFLENRDLTGYEFLAGIPGTIGGALTMNAGIANAGKRYNISDIVYKLKVINQKAEVLNLLKSDISFGYRNSDLDKYIILEAELKLKNGNKLDAKDRIRSFLLSRKRRQDYSRPSAGCIFKNPSAHLSAGQLIDRCGLKGRRFGGAMISERHANFILNFNKATFNDIMQLVRIAKRKVKDNFGIELKEEIKIVS